MVLQVVVAVCNMFLIATKDPKLVPDGDATPAYLLYVSMLVNGLFWGYIVYSAFRFQKALFAWFTQVHPDLILEQNSGM
jgi:hypothetical protein